MGKQEACPLLPPSGGFGASRLQDASGAGWHQPRRHGAGQKSAAEDWMAASETGPRVAPRTHASAALLRNRGFADVTHLGIWNAAGLRAGPTPSAKCPYAREGRGEWAEKGEEETEATGRWRPRPQRSSLGPMDATGSGKTPGGPSRRPWRVRPSTPCHLPYK